MTQYLDSLKIGSQIEVCGPKGRLRYIKYWFFKIGDEARFRVKNLALIAGGTGITPCYQLIQYIAEYEPGEVELSLIYANKTEEDILLRENLESLAKAGLLKLYYTLDNPPKNWAYGSGFITQNMLEKNLPPPADSFACYCGPLPMTDIISKHLKAIGYTQTFKF